MAHAPCGCELLGTESFEDPVLQDMHERRARELQREHACDFGCGPGEVGTPSESSDFTAREVGRLVRDPEAFVGGCPLRRLYDADVIRACELRHLASLPGGAALIEASEPDAPGALVDAVREVLWGEREADRLQHERWKREHEKKDLRR